MFFKTMKNLKLKRGFEVTLLLAIIILFTVLLVVPSKLPLRDANLNDYIKGAQDSANETINRPFYAKVTRIIDGDTFQIDTGDKVRLICIDAPELGKKGSEASISYLAKLILSKEVRLEKDINDKDQYGRLLRYVYIQKGENITFVNKEMVSQGYAAVFPYGNDTKLCNDIEGK